VGEGGTTASEAATLGTHAIHISTTAKYCGIFCDLNRYGLLWTSESDEETIQKAIELLQDPNLKNVGQYKRSCLVDEKIDVTAFMVWFIENYPESVSLMQENSDFQYTFQTKGSL
jgi:predicted glycosyltransferase